MVPDTLFSAFQEGGKKKPFLRVEDVPHLADVAHLKHLKLTKRNSRILGSQDGSGHFVRCISRGGEEKPLGVRRCATSARCGTSIQNSQRAIAEPFARRMVPVTLFSAYQKGGKKKPLEVEGL
ncbi:MAG: hypothetical protein HW421_2325 [Ignavibacteria bacterium]|nr:hypothetical protein [Ignavibacteria bacterium]